MSGRKAKAQRRSAGISVAARREQQEFARKVEAQREARAAANRARSKSRLRVAATVILVGIVAVLAALSLGCGPSRRDCQTWNREHFRCEVRCLSLAADLRDGCSPALVLDRCGELFCADVAHRLLVNGCPP